MRFALQQWTANLDFPFHSSGLTSDNTVASLDTRAPRVCISGRLNCSTRRSSGDRKGGWDLDKEGFSSYSLMLSLLPKHAWRQRGDLHMSPNHALCVCECLEAHSCPDLKDRPLLLSDLDAFMGVQELRALVRHGEPFEASATFASEVLWARENLFQNQSNASAPPIYALQTPEAIFKTGFSQCMQGATAPLLFLPRSNNTDSFHTYLPV